MPSATKCFAGYQQASSLERSGEFSQSWWHLGWMSFRLESLENRSGFDLRRSNHWNPIQRDVVEDKKACLKPFSLDHGQRLSTLFQIQERSSLEVCGMSYVVAFLETFSISAFPYYSFEDRAQMYTIGCLAGHTPIKILSILSRLRVNGRHNLIDDRREQCPGPYNYNPCILLIYIVDLGARPFRARCVCNRISWSRAQPEPHS